MSPISMIPAQYRALALIVAIALVCLAIFAAGWSHGAGSVQAKWDAEKIILQQQAHATELASRAKEQSLMNKLTEAQNAATIREQKIRADADAARAAAGGLHDTIAALRGELSKATAEACRSTADAALAVFGECQARYGALAEAADRHASDAELCLDAWPE